MKVKKFMVYSDKFIEEIEVTREERLVSRDISSIGNQIKWKHGDKYIKLDCLGYEGIAESLVSWFMRFTDIPETDYVKYTYCRIIENGKYIGTGCYSLDYLKEMSEITFLNILEKNMIPTSISYDELRDIMLDNTGIDVKNYLDRILCLDSIIRNEARHFGNLGFMMNKNEIRLLPIFDNGGSCLSDTISYPFSESFENNYKSIMSKPFRTDFKQQLNQIKAYKKIGVKYNDFVESLRPCSKEARRATQTIIKGLKEMKGVAWEDI